MGLFTYPAAFRDPDSKVEYHGQCIADPYQWTEEPDLDRTKKFVEAQNQITHPFLQSAPDREYFKTTLTGMINYPKYSSPWKEGNHWYHNYNSGLQNQYVVRRQRTFDDEPEVFLDPNTFSEDGTSSLSILEFSKDGSMCAYGISESGYEWVEVRFKNSATGDDLPDKLSKLKMSNLCFTESGSGCFYASYKDAPEGASLLHHKIYFHRLGEEQSQDTVILELPEHPEWMFPFSVSNDYRYLVVTPMKDCTQNQVYVADLENWDERTQLKFYRLVREFKNNFSYVGNLGSKFIFRTNQEAPNSKVVTLDLGPIVSSTASDYSVKFEDLIPENSNDILSWAGIVDTDKLFVRWMRDVQHRLQVFDARTGVLVHDFDQLNGILSGFSFRYDQSWFFFKQVTFTNPGLFYKGEVGPGNQFQIEIFREVKVPGVDAKNYEMSQVFYNSHDGTKISMFLANRRGIDKSGNLPTLLYGYGGFNISIQPEYSSTWLHWLTSFDGIVAIANIRGGGEHGRAWHNGAKKLTKKNCFLDFIAAAEYLIREGYTKPERLVIKGGSNGGLLVAACCNMRPDLFAVGLPFVGVMDMLRYHKFTIGHAWMDDYGDPEETEEMFGYLLSYSPLHNIPQLPDGKEYPAMLLMTADHDDRVLPFHSLKFIAELQHRMGHQEQPLLIRVDTKSGHGVGKPIGKYIDETVDTWSFVQLVLGIPAVKK